jgi:hypothetical protein
MDRLTGPNFSQLTTYKFWSKLAEKAPGIQLPTDLQLKEPLKTFGVEAFIHLTNPQHGLRTFLRSFYYNLPEGPHHFFKLFPNPDPVVPQPAVIPVPMTAPPVGQPQIVCAAPASPPLAIPGAVRVAVDEEMLGARVMSPTLPFPQVDQLLFLSNKKLSEMAKAVLKTDCIRKCAKPAIIGIIVKGDILLSSDKMSSVFYIPCSKLVNHLD